MASPMPADDDILGALQEPVRGRLSRAEDRDVSVVRPEPQLCRANLTREQRPCELGAIRSWPPCTMRTGEWIDPGSKPHGATYARSSSTIPPMPPSRDRPATFPSHDHAPLSASSSAGVNISGSNSVAAR